MTSVWEATPSKHNGDVLARRTRLCLKRKPIQQGFVVETDVPIKASAIVFRTHNDAKHLSVLGAVTDKMEWAGQGNQHSQAVSPFSPQITERIKNSSFTLV